MEKVGSIGVSASGNATIVWSAWPRGCRPAAGFRPNAGFTLIEILIALAILVVLLAIALPSYQSQIRKSRRADAIQALTSVQLAQEKFRASNTSYGSTLNTALGFSGTTFNSDQGYYTISLSGVSATGYTVTATAVSGKSQVNDTGCTPLTLTIASGTITPGPTATCWNR